MPLNTATVLPVGHTLTVTHNHLWVKPRFPKAICVVGIALSRPRVPASDNPKI